VPVTSPAGIDIAAYIAPVALLAPRCGSLCGGIADSDEVAPAFRDDLAHRSDMMSPGVPRTECHALFGQFPLRALVFGQVRQTHAAEDVRCFGELDIVIANDLEAVAPWIAEV
jgi:hypothetical protein